MVLRKFMGIFAITLIIGAASLAMAGVPDVSNCTATRATTGGKLVVLAVPGGEANATFDQAVVYVTYTGVAQPQVIQDATISVTIKDGGGVPINLYPFEDIWLVCPGVGGEVGLAPCPGGNTADASTDALGFTEFNNPVSGGGQSTGATTVSVNGNAISPTVDVCYVSPDLNGDTAVDIIDFQQFVVDYKTGYNFKSDIYHDGIVDIVDFQKFVSWYGAVCM